MIAEAGLIALWLAAALSLLQLGLGVAALNSSPAFAGEGDRPKGGGGALPSPESPSTALGAVPLPEEISGRNLASAVRPIAVVQAALVGLSFLALIQLFLRTDLSVKLVASNSHSLKPWIYKFAGTWGNHEGSMLLWVTVLALAGAAVALLERRLPERTLIATLAAQAAIGLGFYAFLLFSSNPFERLSPVPSEGNGLNPLLQDLGLAFHPPTLYFGYVG
ncbi:MAG TPA: cytochrome c biogenesis protein CcsA, partial [Allosphingosinicella sp.]|nr:cytochrome c biogenesis protein CcsA [Allosphingosinicella sp.]